MPIPSLDGLPKPVFEDLHVVDMMPLHGSPDDDALHRFGQYSGQEPAQGVYKSPMPCSWHQLTRSRL